MNGFVRFERGQLRIDTTQEAALAVALSLVSWFLAPEMAAGQTLLRKPDPPRLAQPEFRIAPPQNRDADILPGDVPSPPMPYSQNGVVREPQNRNNSVLSQTPLLDSMKSQELRNTARRGQGGDDFRPTVGDFEFPERNIFLRNPGRMWLRSRELESLGPDLVLVLSVPERLWFFMVTENDIGTDVGATSELFVEISRSRQRKLHRDYRFERTQPLTLGGIPGLLAQSQGRNLMGNPQIPMGYLQWFAVHNGRAFTLSMSGPSNEAAEWAPEARRIMSGFQTLDPKHVIREVPQLRTKLVQPRWGVNADFSGTGWAKHSKLTTTSGDDGVVAECGDLGVLHVVPFSLLGNKLPRNLVLGGLLSQLQKRTEEDVSISTREIKLGSLSGIQTELPNLGSIETVVFVVDESVAWLISINIDAAYSGRAEMVKQLISRIALARPATPPSSRDLLPKEKSSHAHFFNSLAMRALQSKQYEPARLASTTALTLQPQDLTLQGNFVDVLLACGDKASALRRLEHASPGLLMEPERQAQLGWLLGEAGRNEEAIKAYREVFASDFHADDHLDNYLSLLADAGHLDEALKVVESELANRTTTRLILARASLLSQLERHDDAINLLKKQRQESPLAGPDFTYALIDILLTANRPQEALEETQSLIAADLDGVRTQLWKGVAEMKLDRLRDARRTFEGVLEKESDNATAKRLLDAIAAKLGQGDFAEIRAPIPPVELPADIQKSLGAKPVVREGDSVCIPFSGKAISFQPGKDYRVTLTTIIQVLDRNGVENYSSLQFPLSPLHEQVCLNRVDVFDERGQHTGRVKIEDCYVRSANESGLATSKKILHVPVPGLRPGGRIEYQITYRERNASDRFPFQQHDSTRTAPTGRTVLFVTGDVSTVHWSGPSPKQTPAGLVWDELHPARQPSESLQDDSQPSPTTVSLGDRRLTWPNCASDYLAELKDRLEPSPQITQIVSERLKSHPNASAEEKINLLASWVQQQLTYQGIEFGRRGQIMPPVDETLRNRYGDCKDHSLLLCQLLRAAGIKAHLAVVNSETPLATSVPSLDQFDHMIVFAEDERGGRFLDGTNKSCDAALRVPSGLALRQALVLDPNQPRITQIPDYAPNSGRVFIDRTVTLSNNGNARVTETIQSEGYSAAGYRGILSSVSSDERRRVMEYLVLSRGARCTLGEFRVENLTETSKPLILNVKYDVEDLWHEVSGQLIGRPAAFFETSSFEMHESSPSERQTRFRLRFSKDISVRTRVVLPSGFELTDLPENVSKKTPLADFVRLVSKQEGVLEIRSRVRRRSGSFDASEWKRFDETLTDARQLFAPKMLIRRDTVQQTNRETETLKR